MSKIQVLDRQTAELIAAGEVVERPSSVMKELMENSMDAKASSIWAEITDGGITSMTVRDNGEGMTREDLPVAFLRHATSKVHSAADLEAIGTLGFRGEALASIAAVSKVETVTRRREDLAGTRYTVTGGQPGVLEDCGCPVGTQITVRELFYNVPARMKFLKKNVTEGNAIKAVTEKLALSAPNISFHFIRDGREELVTAGDGNLLGCIHAVLGRDFAKSLLPVEYTVDEITVRGYISSPNAPRANRAMQHVFVNGRTVKSRTVTTALEQAYKGRIMVGRFPACVLFLEMPFQTVDANVHPAKVEIRFTDERPVFSAVFHAVGTALEQPAAPKAVIIPKPDVKPQFTMDWQPAENTDIIHIRSRNGMIYSDEADRGEPLSVHDIAEQWGNLQKPSEPPGQPKPPINITAEPQKPVTYIGELFSVYLLAEMNGVFYIIDKHAAHERLLYNQLISKARADSQQLIDPVSVSLSAEEYAALAENLETVRKAGFEIEEFGGREMLVRAVPMMLTGCDIPAAIQELAGGLLSGNRQPQLSKLEWIYRSVACRAAIKSGDENSPEELSAFAQKVLHDADLQSCPHGRPVYVTLTKKEIEKQFGRLG